MESVIVIWTHILFYFLHIVAHATPQDVDIGFSFCLCPVIVIQPPVLL